MTTFKRLFLKVHILSAFATLLLCIILVGCSDTISGSVYYDFNGNGTKDGNDLSAGYVKVMITKDGEDVTQGISLPDGSFTAKFKPSKKANYCVKIDPSTAQYFGGPFGGEALSTGKVTFIGEKSEPTVISTAKEAAHQNVGNSEANLTISLNTKKVGSDKVEVTANVKNTGTVAASGVKVKVSADEGYGVQSADSGCTSQGTSSTCEDLNVGAGLAIQKKVTFIKESSTVRTVEVRASVTSKNADGEDVTVDADPVEVNMASTGSSDSDSTTADDKVTGSGSGYCKKTRTGFSVEVGVNVDFSKALSNVPARLEVKCYSGIVCPISIVLPEGCSLETMTLPDGLAYGTAPASQSQSQIQDKQISLKTQSTDDTETTTTTAGSSPVYSVSEIKKSNIYLIADKDIPQGETSVELKPSAKCFESSLPLPTIPIKLIRNKPDLRISQSAKRLGTDKVEISVKIENRGKGEIREAEIIMTGADGFEVFSVDPTCNNLISGVQCVGLEVPSDSTVSKKVTYIKKVDYDSVAEFKAKVIVHDDKEGLETIEAENVKLQPEPIANDAEGEETE